MHKDFPSILCENWDKSIKKLLSQSFCSAGTRVVTTKILLRCHPAWHSVHYTHSAHTIICRPCLRSVCSVAPTQAFTKAVRFALRRPFAQAFSHCNLTICSSLMGKYQRLLFSIKGFIPLFNFLYINIRIVLCQQINWKIYVRFNELSQTYIQNHHHQKPGHETESGGFVAFAQMSLRH